MNTLLYLGLGYGTWCLTKVVMGTVRRRVKGEGIDQGGPGADPTASASSGTCTAASSTAASRSNMQLLIELPPPASADTEETVALKQQYNKMMQDFVTHNLDSKAISQMQPWFHGLQEGEVPWPKLYDQMEPPFPPSSVRLLVLPLDCSPPICTLAVAAARLIAGLLPPGTKIFANARSQYHCTLFHTSHPVDTRPDPFSPDGGVGVTPTAPHARTPVSQATLDRETQVISDVVASTAQPRLELHSVVMTRTGTLLLTWVDNTGNVTRLRQQLRAALPGATSKQANIIHTSLLRILSDQPLPEDIVARVNASCAELTESLRGRVLVPTSLWWITEVEFSTVVGPRQVLPLTQRQKQEFQ